MKMSKKYCVCVNFIPISVLRLIAGAGEVTTPEVVNVTEGGPARIPCVFNDTHLVGMEWKRGTEVLIRVFKQR